MKVLFGSNCEQNSNTGTMQPDTTLLTLDPLPRFGMSISCTHTGWTCKWNVSTNYHHKQTGRIEGIPFSLSAPWVIVFRSTFCLVEEVNVSLALSDEYSDTPANKQTNTSLLLSSLRTVHSSPFSWSDSTNSSGQQFGLLHKTTKCSGRFLSHARSHIPIILMNLVICYKSGLAKTRPARLLLVHPYVSLINLKIWGVLVWWLFEGLWPF